MQTRTLGIDGPLEFSALQFPDNRGNFAIWFEADTFEAVIGQPFPVAKTHHSVSKYGTIRGIHFTALPPGQRKYVYCPKGRIFDVLVDLRVGSSTFGKTVSTTLSAELLNAIYIPEGIGHGFAALEEASVVSYMCTTPFDPRSEVEIDPFDADISISWPHFDTPILSERDANAQSFREAAERKYLPSVEDC